MGETSPRQHVSIVAGIRDMRTSTPQHANRCVCKGWAASANTWRDLVMHAARLQFLPSSAGHKREMLQHFLAQRHRPIKLCCSVCCSESLFAKLLLVTVSWQGSPPSQMCHNQSALCLFVDRTIKNKEVFFTPARKTISY